MKRTRMPRIQTNCVWLLLLIPSLSVGQTFRQDSLSIAKLTNDSVRIAKMAVLGANIIYQDAGTYEQGLACLRQAEQWNKQADLAILTPFITLQQGILEQSANNYPKALQTYYNAEQMYRRLNEHAKVVEIMTRIQIMYTRTQEYAKARKILLDALTYLNSHPTPKTKYDYLLGTLYQELSNVAGMMKDENQSLAYGLRAMQIYKESNDEQSYYGMVMNMGIKYKNRKQYAKSMEMYRLAEKYAIRVKDDYLLTFIYANIPRALIGLKQYDEATAYAQKSIAMAEKLPEKTYVQADVYEALVQIKEQQGDYKQALANLRKQHALNDSIVTFEKQKELKKIETRYETQRKEEQIQALNRENKTKNWQMLALGGGIILLTSMLYLLYRQYGRLAESRQQIQRQSEQLTIMMKELHHRVKNNLAIVSGLLELQSNRLEDQDARRAFLEGQQRVQAMSLIHQRLYKSDQITTINIQTYVHELTINLMDAYGLRDRLDFRFSSDFQELDIDVAIPLGLIINELLTNAMKYAYNQVKAPVLHVSLKQDNGLTLEVQDNGPGIDMTQWRRPGPSFGKRLIVGLSEQLNGVLTVEKRNGTFVRLHIPVDNLQPA